MLSNIIKNSDKLINSQFYENDELKQEIMKIKTKKRNNGYFQASKNRESIFSEPQFMQKLNLNIFNRKNRASYTTQTYRIRSQSQKINFSSSVREKFKTMISKQHSEDDIKLGIGSQKLTNKNNKIIHSRKNVKNNFVNKTTKYPFKKLIKSQILECNIIEQPGIVNLCFYKNKLQELQKIQTQRAVQTRKQNFRKQKKCQSQRNKIKFIKYNAVIDQNLECRPWSTFNENQANESQFLNFRSLMLKN